MILFLKNKLKTNQTIVKSYDKLIELYYKYYISDKGLIEKKFIEKLGREVNLKNPIKFNDKLQWLKLNWYNPLATKCADKYEVREFVAARIGKKYLNELYAVYESVDEIDLTKLPNAFVLKGTHRSGSNIVCENKSKMNWDEELRKMRRLLGINYYWRNREWVYKDIKPRIICEKFIEQNNGDELLDYRFFCFNGEPKLIAVDFNITNKEKTRRNLYDLEWNLIEAEITYPKELSVKLDKPGKLDEMINLSRQLSSEFPHARVDFYYINDRIIFGEITFFHQSGMGQIKPAEFEDKMGEWLELPQ